MYKFVLYMSSLTLKAKHIKQRSKKIQFDISTTRTLPEQKGNPSIVHVLLIEHVHGSQAVCRGFSYTCGMDRSFIPSTLVPINARSRPCYALKPLDTKSKAESVWYFSPRHLHPRCLQQLSLSIDLVELIKDSPALKIARTFKEPQI